MILLLVLGPFAIYILAILITLVVAIGKSMYINSSYYDDKHCSDRQVKDDYKSTVELLSMLILGPYILIRFISKNSVDICQSLYEDISKEFKELLK